MLRQVLHTGFPLLLLFCGMICRGREPHAREEEQGVPPWTNLANRATTGLEEITLEGGSFVGTNDQADAIGYFKLQHGLEWLPDPSWEFRLGIRAQGQFEPGTRRFEDTLLLPHESFLRFRTPDRRITLGMQTVRWGRLDFSSPTDQMAVQDLTRGVAAGRSGNRLAVPSVRWEEYFRNLKVDLLWLPRFTPAKLPRADSIWYPINRNKGRILGIPYDRQLAEFLQQSTIDDSRPSSGSGGGGIRLSRDGPDFDWAVTAQRVRRPMPYFEIDPVLRPLLPDELEPQDVSDAGVQRETFSAVHPWTTVLGADLGWARDQATWRMEAAWLSDSPVTTWEFHDTTIPALFGGIAWEYFPEHWDARFQLQLNLRHNYTRESTLERRTRVGLAGDFELFWDRQQWRARMNYLMGINNHEWYLNPELTRLTARHGEWYLAAHIFFGDAGTLGGFYQDNDLLLVGWRKMFH